MNRILPLALLLALPLSAAVPTISGITKVEQGHSHVRYVYEVDTTGTWAQILWGTSTGTYPYSSHSYQAFIVDGHTYVSITIGGLKPSTTYYMLMTQRPNKDDDTDICDDSGCGSTEQSFTTDAEPSPHPGTPNLPEDYDPQQPDTTGYTVYPMEVGGSGHCVAASTVGSVTAGDDFQEVINTVGYGSIIQFPQGAECEVPLNSFDVFDGGYRLPDKTVDPTASDIDDPDHRWIVIETVQSDTEDFPPPGTRTGPAWAAKMAKFIPQDPQSGTAGTKGLVFDCVTQRPHHIWIRNVEMYNSPDNFLANIVDPKPFSAFIHCTGDYGTDDDDIPIYIVLDRLYLHDGPNQDGDNWPIRTLNAVNFAGEYQAMLDTHLGPFDIKRVGIYPTSTPVISGGGTQLDIAQDGFAFSANDAEIQTDGAAIFTITGASGITGNYRGYIRNPDGELVIEIPTGTATLNCTNCTVSQVATPSYAETGYRWFGGTITAGVLGAATSYVNRDDASTRDAWHFGIQLFQRGKGPYRFENNYIEAYGLAFYVDAGYDTLNSNDDQTWIHNHFVWKQDRRFTADNSDGYQRYVRQLWESKKSRRHLLDGNLFEGGWSFQNEGPAIFFSGRPTYTRDNPINGVKDGTVTNNIIRHGGVGIDCMGASPGGAQGSVSERFLIENNLMYDLNRWEYNDNGPGFTSGYFQMYDGCQDMNIRFNTMGYAGGRGPYITLIGGGSTLGEGLSFTDNLLYFSVGPGGSGIGSDDAEAVASHPRLPDVNGTGTHKEKLDSFFVRVDSGGVAAEYDFTNNVIIGGTTSSNDTGTDATSLTGAQVTTHAGNMPSSNFWPSGETVAARETTADIVDASTYNYRLGGSSPYLTSGAGGVPIGADWDALDVAQGLVKDVSVTPITGGLTVAYTAPDSRECFVETSVASADSWTRVGDGGGATSRSEDITGLSGSNDWRILCYYRQINDGWSLTDYPSSQITEGTETAGSGSQSLSISGSTGFSGSISIN